MALPVMCGKTVVWLSALILIWQNIVACCMRLPCSELPTGEQLFEAERVDVTQLGGDVPFVCWGLTWPVSCVEKGLTLGPNGALTVSAVRNGLLSLGCKNTHSDWRS